MEKPVDGNLNPEPQPGAQGSPPPKIDTGLACLVLMAKVNGVAADPEQIRHAFAIGADGAKTLDILRAAKEIGFKAKSATLSYERLAGIQLPAIAETSEGRFILLAKAQDDSVLVLDPAESKPRPEKEEFLGNGRGN